MVALIGDSKIILLDEPTSSVDPLTKKEICKFLKEYKKNKIIIITTHYLEEAEYLGDRIGILYDGHFICSGTSTYLKSKYCNGFNINLIINSKIFNEYNKQIFLEALKKIDNDFSIRIDSIEMFSINLKSNEKTKKLVTIL